MWYNTCTGKEVLLFFTAYIILYLIEIEFGEAAVVEHALSESVVVLLILVQNVVYPLLHL